LILYVVDDVIGFGFANIQIVQNLAEVWRKKGADVSTIDGVHIQTNDFWVQLRKSNTEPVVRVISEARTIEEATRICNEFMQLLGTK
jgi:phosphomannomutase